MRLLIMIAALSFISCDQNPSKTKKIQPKEDSLNTSVDTVKTLPVINEKPATYFTPDEGPVNEMLKAKYGNQWHVLNDQESSWMKDAFDYFIVPKRKENPNYPYITKGDFNADGITDIAAVVTNENKSKYQVAIIVGPDKILFWSEDVLEDAAISTVTKAEIDGMEQEKIKKVKLKGDGITIDYFERGSFVVYWDKNSFKRIQTGD